MRITRNFTLGVMNRDVDERTLPNGMYRHAENIRVTNSDGSNAGLVEDIKGTTLLAQIGNMPSFQSFTEAEVIGTGKDTYSGCIYWLVWTNGDDYLVEYNTVTGEFKRVLQHGSILGLSKEYPVNEIHIIRDSYSGNVYATWTDNNKPPRFVNINRAKTWGVGAFTEDDITLIKKPPRKEPEITMLSSPSTKENNIEEKFLAFAYRYKYLDGEYSALSAFSPYAFTPKPFELDFATKENVGMVNQFNAVRILFETGSKRVTDIDLVFKESGSNTIYKIQTFNKQEEGWGNNLIQEFTFINDKVYSVLPEKELYRLYDSVPLKAGDVSVIDNRLVFFDVTEGRNMVDSAGNKVNVDYELELVGGELVSENLPVTNAVTSIINFNDVSLSEGKRLIFKVYTNQQTYSAWYNGNFEYILPQDYDNLTQLATSVGFKDFVETLWTDAFMDGSEMDIPDNSVVSLVTGFQIMPNGMNAGYLYLKAPYVMIRTDNTPNNPNDDNYTYDYALFNFKNPTSVQVSNLASTSSLKSNRSYEVGVVYLDPESRQSPTLVDRGNTLFVPIDRSTYKNQIQVSLKNNPPAWADRYRFVLKTNKHGHETIYISTFYFDGAYVWCLLDGVNRNKVKEGDTLIVKSDVNGQISEVVKSKILEVKDQPTGFLNNNDDSDDTIAQGLAGVYMKIRPNGFSMGEANVNFAVFYAYSRYRNNYELRTMPIFGTYNEDHSISLYKLTGGSTVRIWIRFWRHGGDGFDIHYDKTFTVDANYDSYKEWFETEVGSLPEFEQLVYEEGNYQGGAGFIDDWGYGTGYGFVGDGSNFWVRQRGTGTGPRQLYTEVKWEVYTAETNNIIFETEPKELDVDVYYETGQTFEIVNGKHQGNVQNQNDSEPAICLLNSFNCFVQGNGAESYKIKDDFNGKALNIDLRPTTTTDDEYKERNLFSAFTWGGNYEEFTQYNSLNEFNRSTLNIKQLDDKYGKIRRGIPIDDSLICFQDDKVSRVLYRRRMLFNQDGSSNVGATDVDFGDQNPFTGEYGVSANPESIAIDKKRIYFTDRKRGVPCRLSIDGIEEIPGYYYETGNIRREMMSTYFKELFRKNPNIKCYGVFDPEYDEYVLHFENLTAKHNGLRTIGYRQEAGNAGGWTSFYSYNPDRMISLNGKLYGFKNGDLYVHNDDAINRNTFYGTKYNSRIITVINDFPSEVKVFNALNIEGNAAWEINFETNLTNGHISLSEFREIEKEWYANFMKNEAVTLNSLATQGIGVSDQVSLGAVRFTAPVNSAVSTGDMLYMNGTETPIGTITGINGNVITYNNQVNAPVVGGFFFAQKSARIEGSAIRGYYMDIELTHEGNERIELFSLNAEVSKSFP